jgi:uncharacterized protein YrrD
MRIQFGASVFGRGGKRLGEVDGLVVDAGTKRARAILVDEGLFDTTKQIVDIAAIASSDENETRLEDSAAKTDAQAPVLESESVAFAERVPDPTTFIPAAGVGGPVIADPPPAPGEYPTDDSFFDIAPLSPPPVEVFSNLDENEVILGRDTDAISKDDHKVGDVVAFELGERGVVDAIDVSEGFIFKERATFALSEIDEFGTDKVHLNVTRAQVEAR